MISGDGLDDVGEALQLIEGLARLGQRTWCLADLIERGGLDADALARVIAAAPSDASRRRLARRAASPRRHAPRR